MQNTLNQKKIIGLTGGIGSGKSTAGKILETLGADVYDADTVVHELLAHDVAIKKAIVEYFGPSVNLDNQHLNRQYLRKQILNNPDAKQWLESLLHPKVREILYNAAQKSTAAYCVLVVPLLCESNAYDFVDEIWVVDLPESLQIERALARGNMNHDEIQQMMSHQLSRQERLSHATLIIDNSQDVDFLINQLENKL